MNEFYYSGPKVIAAPNPSETTTALSAVMMMTMMRKKMILWEVTSFNCFEQIAYTYRTCISIGQLILCLILLQLALAKSWTSSYIFDISKLNWLAGSSCSRNFFQIGLIFSLSIAISLCGCNSAAGRSTILSFRAVLIIIIINISLWMHKIWNSELINWCVQLWLCISWNAVWILKEFFFFLLMGLCRNIDSWSAWTFGTF